MGDDTNTPLPDAGETASVDATVAGAADAADTVTVAVVRLANWSPDAPAIDFCLAAHGTSVFRGPLLSNSAGEDSGADGGAALPFPAVSAYLYLAPGHYDARVVVAGAGDCAAGIGPDLTTLPALARGAFATIALVGDAHAGSDAGLEMVGFSDDEQAAGDVALRFINAAPSVAGADMGTGTLATTFKPLFVDVAFAHAGGSANAPPDASASIDSNGYAGVKALSLSTLSAHAFGATEDTAIAPDFSAASGSVLTLVLIGPDPAAPAPDAGEIPPPRLLECVDNAGTIGLLGSCSVVSQ
jgi:hypothetical protein